MFVFARDSLLFSSPLPLSTLPPHQSPPPPYCAIATRLFMFVYSSLSSSFYILGFPRSPHVVRCPISCILYCIAPSPRSVRSVCPCPSSVLLIRRRGSSRTARLPQAPPSPHPSCRASVHPPMMVQTMSQTQQPHHTHSSHYTHPFRHHSSPPHKCLDYSDLGEPASPLGQACEKQIELEYMIPHAICVRNNSTAGSLSTT